MLHAYRYPRLQVFRGNITRGLYPEKKYKSPFCSKSLAKQAFEKIFELVKSKNACLILSYSESKSKDTGNERMVSLDQILRLSYSLLPNYNIRQIDFDFEYRQLNSKAKTVKNKEDKEILLVFEKI